MRKILDKRITLSASRGAEAALRRVFGRGLCLSVALSLALNSNTNTISTANAYPLKRYQQEWAMVAMNHLGSWQEGWCWVSLIWRESRFDPKAKNGSHYGLAQMRSVWYRDLNAIDQVKAHLRYLDRRYPGTNGIGSACKALDHLERRGWH